MTIFILLLLLFILYLCSMSGIIFINKFFIFFNYKIGLQMLTTSSIKTEYNNIIVSPLAGSLGAEVQNVNLSKNMSDEIMSDIYNALLDYQVIFFRDQKFDPASQKLFANKIGKPVVYPFVKGLEDFPEITPILKKETDINNFGGIWHSDTTYQEKPPMGTMLYALETPEFGGDTEFANQYLAYERLSDGMRKFLDTLKGVTDVQLNNIVAQILNLSRSSCRFKGR